MPNQLDYIPAEHSELTQASLSPPRPGPYTTTFFRQPTTSISFVTFSFSPVGGSVWPFFFGKVEVKEVIAKV